MAKKGKLANSTTLASSPAPKMGKPSSLLDTRVVYCGHNLDQLAKLPNGCVDLISIDAAFDTFAMHLMNKERRSG